MSKRTRPAVIGCTIAAALLVVAALSACSGAPLAVAPASGLTAQDTSQAATPTVLPRPTLSVSAPIAVRAGSWFKVTGKASKTVATTDTVLVLLQRLSGGKWSTASTRTATVTAAHVVSARVKAPGRGHLRVRIVAIETTTHASATSSYRAVKAVGSKVIALTFDDGPWRSSTDRMVAALKKADVTATFFMLGAQVNGQRALAKKVVQAGNLVGVHSWNHPIMVRRSDKTNKADLKRCKATIKSATGITPLWFRPPYGSTNAALKRVAKSVGLRQVIWDVDTLDWKFRTVGSVTSRALAGARNGAVVLMHDGGGNRSATVAAVPRIIAALRKKGYDFVRLDELVALGYQAN